MIKDALKMLSYALFPKRCSLCGSVVAFDEQRCEACSSLERIKNEICNVCGCEKENCTCTKHTSKPEYKSVVAPFYFQGNIVHAIHNFKFNGYKELSTELAKEISNAVNERYSDVIFDAVCYVPMSAKRESKRGYNQSLLLAESVADNTGIELSHSLKKLYETASQRGSSARKRSNNLYGSFDINVPASDVADKVLLLVDDVKTTGSTLNECSKVLKRNKANKVYAVAIAATEG